VDGYSVFIKPSAAKDLEALPPKDLEQIVDRIRALADDPRAPGAEKLSGQPKYRVRQGDYRIVYSIDDRGRAVRVVRIGHRKDVYR
jgi:mRNA interferase RelE/StbE